MVRSHGVLRCCTNCRKLYWTDVGLEPRIEASNLDGSERVAMVTSGLGQPNHVTIDYRRGALCWSDARLDRVECASLTGGATARRTVLELKGSDIYGIAVFQVGVWGGVWGGWLGVGAWVWVCVGVGGWVWVCWGVWGVSGCWDGCGYGCGGLGMYVGVWVWVWVWVWVGCVC